MWFRMDHRRSGNYAILEAEIPKDNRRCFAALSMTACLGLIGADDRPWGNFVSCGCDRREKQPQILRLRLRMTALVRLGATREKEVRERLYWLAGAVPFARVGSSGMKISKTVPDATVPDLSAPLRDCGAAARLRR